MVQEKTLLLEKINAAIKENISNLNLNFPEILVDENNSTASLSEKMDNLREYIPVSKMLQAIAKLEQRVEALEKQNDNLLYFIHFIYENFSELISSCVMGKKDQQSTVKRSETITKPANEKKGPGLTRREAEVLDFLVKGLCVKEIASKLFISENTVITHKKNLKEKFQARNTVDMISKAFQLT